MVCFFLASVAGDLLRDRLGEVAEGVNTLKVLIANSQVAGFSSHVELLVNKLFGEPATQIGAPDNNLGFDGYYQKSSDTVKYVDTANTSHINGERNCGQIPCETGIGNNHHPSHTRPT